MKRLSILAVFASLFLQPGLLLADWAKIPSQSFELSAPPREGSAAYRRDFEVLKEHQRTRSAEQCDLARRQEHPSFDSMFAAEESPLSAAEARAAESLVAKVMKLAERISSYHKGKFRRPRPYDVDDTIEPCVTKLTGARAYPSSHAAAAAAGACVLATIFPAKERALLAYGDSLGDLRAVVGVHHPSDVKAGQILGRELCERLQSDEEFREELEKIR